MSRYLLTYMMLCVYWYHLHNLKKLKNTHGGVLFLVKYQGEACNFTKTNAPPWVFFSFFKLCKWHQIAQRAIYMEFLSNCLVSNFIFPVLVNIFYTAHYIRLHYLEKCYFIFNQSIQLERDIFLDVFIHLS